MKSMIIRPFASVILGSFVLVPFVTRADDSDRSSNQVKQQQQKSQSSSPTTNTPADSSSPTGNPDVNSAGTNGAPSDQPSAPATGTGASDDAANTAMSQKYVDLWNKEDWNVASFNTSAAELFDAGFKLKSDAIRALAGEQLSTEADDAAAPAQPDGSNIGTSPVTPDAGSQPGTAPAASGDAAIIMKAMEQLRKAAPDFNVKLDDAIALRQAVIARWTATGTQSGILLGINPTNKLYKVTGVDIHKFANGRLAEITSVPDTTRLIAALRSALGLSQPASPVVP